MPIASPRPCATAGCDQLVSHGRCPAHTKEVDKTYPRRGADVYRTPRWKRRSKAFLAKHPWCATYDCLNLATDCDHRLPIGTEGVDPWDETNWQGLCHKHHSSKTRQEVFGFKKSDRTGY